MRINTAQTEWILAAKSKCWRYIFERPGWDREFLRAKVLDELDDMGFVYEIEEWDDPALMPK